jgi:hypothetical protein
VADKPNEQGDSDAMKDALTFNHDTPWYIGTPNNATQPRNRELPQYCAQEAEATFWQNLEAANNRTEPKAAPAVLVLQATTLLARK